MAATATTLPTARPRRRILLALLAVSAALNLFFVAGAVWIRIHAQPPAWGMEQRFRRMASELDLDPQQRASFDRYVAAMRARNETMHQQLAPLIGSVWNEIAKPQADQARIMRQYDEASEKWREFQHESTVQTLNFLATLSPAQRDKFVAIARERWQRHHPQNR